MTQPCADRPEPDDVAIRRLLARSGSLLVQGGSTITDAEVEVRRLASHLGHPTAQVYGSPTGITVALASGEPATVERIMGGLRLDQTLLVRHVQRRLMLDEVTPQEAEQQMLSARRLPHRYGRVGFVLGSLLVAMGICMILQPGWANVLVAGGCSFMVSGLMVASRRHAVLAALLPTVAAFCTSLVVLLASRAGLVEGPLRTLICPIAVLLPGALLSSGIADLATGALVSGTSRLAHGVVQLLLFALGVVGASMLLGIPSAQLTNTRVDGLGLWSLPVGLALIAVGITLSESVPWSMFGWSSLVLASTFATQILGQRYGGSMPVGAFCGAVVATFASTTIEAIRPTVPRLITFLPSFWLLVPGTLGLMGITTMGLGTGQADAVFGVITFITAIALGLLVGSALALPLTRVGRRMQQITQLRR